MKRQKMPLERQPMTDLARPLKGEMQSGKGRKLGEKLRTTTVLKDAILYAAQIVGEDGKGLNGLVGYLTSIAKTDPRTFAALLARVIPLTVSTTTTTEVIYKSVEEVKAELHARGIHIDRIYH